MGSEPSLSSKPAGSAFEVVPWTKDDIGEIGVWGNPERCVAESELGIERGVGAFDDEVDCGESFSHTGGNGKSPAVANSQSMSLESVLCQWQSGGSKSSPTGTSPLYAI